jgi:hypothetical protein
MADIPVVVTSTGAQPTPPATLLADLITLVTATNPGYTANLPGSLVEDITSTSVGALATCDSARVETINSITPYGANDFMLAQLGQIYIGPGAAPAVPTNASVFVEFTAKNTAGMTPAQGFVIGQGFTVSDNTFQYVVQDGGVTDANGLATLFCICTTVGNFVIAPFSVTTIITSVPSGITLTCTNSTAGTSSPAAETAAQYRARVLQAGQAISQGMTTMLKTLLGQVPGVQQRLISVQQQASGGFEVICGGGDPYLVAGAIFDAVLDFTTLVGSTMAVTNITQASPGVVTTLLNHGFANGQVVQINGVVGMTQINGLNLTIAVIDEKTFSVGISTSGFSMYVSGGVVSPNLRNVQVSIHDTPDIYSIVFVNPPNQQVTMTISWNTTLPNFVSAASVAQVVAPAMADYINSIVVGQPINLLVAEQVFLTAVTGILLPSQVSVINFTILIAGVTTAPEMGTDLVFGDPESYFSAVSSGIAVNQA